MKLNDILKDTQEQLKRFDCIPKSSAYREVQENLRKCEIVVDHILREKLKGCLYFTDVSEYFNQIIVRVDSGKPSIDDMNQLDKYCKDFKQLFLENNININITFLLGNVKKDKYYYITTY